jgi:hypothetical protein
MWDYLLKFLIMSLLSELFRPKPKVDRPAAAGLKDIGLPTADEQRPLAYLVGKGRQDAPNLTGTFDFKTVARSKKVRSGLVTSTTVPLGYDYYVGSSMTLCAGAGVRLREIWAGSGDNAVLIWSGNVASGGTATLNYSKTEKGNEDYPQGFKGVVEFYSGATTPSAYLTAKLGAGNVPSWPHATYVVLRGATVAAGGMWLGTTGQVLPLSFVIERTPTDASVGLGAIPGDITKADANGDANAALAIAELLTNRTFWAGEHPDFINATSFWDAARACQTEDHFLGTLIDQQRATSEVVFEFCRQIGAVLQPDPSTGNHTLKLLRAGDTPVLTLDDSNIESLASFSRTSQDDATNAVTVSYLDRAVNKSRPYTVQDLAAIQAAGVVISSTSQYSALTSALRASITGTRDLRAMSSPLASARLTAIVPKKQRLLPGDLVVFSSVKNGILSLRMRVTSARFSQPGKGTCELELIEDVFSGGMAIYGAPLASYLPGVLTPPGQIETAIFGWPNGVIAPREMSGAEPDKYHAVFFAGSDAANVGIGYRVGYLDTGTTSVDEVPFNEKGTVGFASKGILVANTAVTGNGMHVNVSLSTADAETVRRNGSAVVWICRDDHTDTPIKSWYKGTAVLTGANTAQLTLTSGVPGGGTWYAYDDFWLLYDYAVDPKPIGTTVFSTGTEDVVIDGDLVTVTYNIYKTTGGNPCRAQTIGAGGYGVWAALPYPRNYDLSIASNKTLPRWNQY